MSISNLIGKRPLPSSSSSEESGDGSQPQVKRTHRDLPRCQFSCSYVEDAINKKFKEEIQPVVEDAIQKMDHHVEQMAGMISGFRELMNLFIGSMGQQNKAPENPAMVTEKQDHHVEQMAGMISGFREFMNLFIGSMRQKNKAPENPAMVTKKQIPIPGTTTETQSHKLCKSELIAKDHQAEQMAKMVDKALESPAMGTEKQSEELWRMNPEDATPLERTPSRSSRSLQLHFKTQLSSSLYTGKQIEGVDGASIRIALIDANTDCVVESGPEASIKLDVVVLKGDFNKDNSKDWTGEEFERCQMQQREGKAPLLFGDLRVTLERGAGELGQLKFTDNSSWHRSKMFKIGLKVAHGHCEGIRIREAITEPLRVKEHRGKSYKKQYPAKPDDEVWRLKNIAKDGAYHKRLETKGVFVVKDFLREYVRDDKSLRNVLGGGMTETKWNGLIDHAKSCEKSGKLYQYSYNEVMSRAVVFDIIGKLKGYTADGCFYSADRLTHQEKEHLGKMVTKAYNTWDHVDEFESSSYSVQNLVPGISPAGAFQGQLDFSNQSGSNLTSFKPPAPSKLPPGSTRMAVQGYNDTEVMRNIENRNLNIGTQNPPMDLINLREAPPYQYSAPTERQLSPPTLHGHRTTSVHLPGDQCSMEKLCSTSPQDDHGTGASMSNSENERFIRSLFEDPPNLPQVLPEDQSNFQLGPFY